MTMSFTTREKGQGLVEYALILVLVALAVIALLSLLGTSVGDVFSAVVHALQVSMPDEPEADCYGSLLLPYMVGATLLMQGVLHLVSKRSSENIGE
jgi:pilus assembly protein Flp/PilA